MFLIISCNTLFTLFVLLSNDTALWCILYCLDLGLVSEWSAELVTDEARYKFVRYVYQQCTKTAPESASFLPCNVSGFDMKQLSDRLMNYESF